MIQQLVFVYLLICVSSIGAASNQRVMVRESSMLKPMEAEAVAIVADSIKSHAHWDAVAMTVRDHFDSKFGKQWQVIIGTLEQAKATSVVHLDHDYLQLSIGKTDLLLFRNKDVDKEIQLNHQLMQAQDRVAILTKNYDLSRKELCQRMTKLKTTLDEKTKMADECHLHMVTTNEQLRRVQEQLEMDKRTRKMAEGKRVADLEAEKVKLTQQLARVQNDLSQFTDKKKIDKARAANQSLVIHLSYAFDKMEDEAIELAREAVAESTILGDVANHIWNHFVMKHDDHLWSCVVTDRKSDVGLAWHGGTPWIHFSVQGVTVLLIGTQAEY